MLADYAARLPALLQEQPLFFPSLAQLQPVQGDQSKGSELPATFRRHGDPAGEFGATVGQHMGRRIPPPDL